jgi:hypothetical protein
MNAEIDFPYKFPVYLSPILTILADGQDHDKQEIRDRILSQFPLTQAELALKPARSAVPVFVNKVAFAFNRLVYHKAIIEAVPGKYRITEHGMAVFQACPSDARERDL